MLASLAQAQPNPAYRTNLGENDGRGFPTIRTPAPVPLATTKTAAPDIVKSSPQGKIPTVVSSEPARSEVKGTPWRSVQPEAPIRLPLPTSEALRIQNPPTAPVVETIQKRNTESDPLAIPKLPTTRIELPPPPATVPPVQIQSFQPVNKSPETPPLRKSATFVSQPIAENAPIATTAQPGKDDIKPVERLVFPNPNGVQRTEYARPRAREAEGTLEFKIRTDLPGIEAQTRRLSEADLLETIRQEGLQRSDAARSVFPERVEISKEFYQGRKFPPKTLLVEPCFVCHGRLHFDQPNWERHGWNLGVAQPVVCASVFLYDAALYPYHFWSNPCDWIECSAGKCLPGDRTPLLLYRERFSWTGLVGQAGVVTSGFFIFP